MVDKLELDRLRALVEAASPLPWVYRPEKYDDWGWIRGVERDDRDIGPFRPIVANAKDSLVREEEMDAHRRSGTDPYGPNAELIVAAVNLIPTLLDQAATPAEDARSRVKVLEEALERAKHKLGHVSVGCMNGDNLAVTLCTHFDDGEGDEDEHGWTGAATAGCDATLKAIHAMYADVLRTALGNKETDRHG